MKFEYLFFVALGLVAASTLYRVIRNRGFRGALFGAPVRATVGEIELRPRGLVKSRLKIHTLGGGRDSPQVGLEITHSTVGSWQMTPVSLTADEARRLAEALERAVRDSGNSSPAG